MTGEKFNTFLNIILVIVIIMIIGAIAFIGYDYFFKKYKNAADAQDEINKIDQYIAENNEIVVDVDEGQTNQEDTNTTNTSQSTSRTYNKNVNYGLTYRGYGVLGKIELPKVGLQYPVLETLTNAKSIDVSVAVQYGARIK